MKAFLKTLVGDVRNIIGVALIVLVAAGLTAIGHGGLAVLAMPIVALGVVGWLARQ